MTVFPVCLVVPASARTQLTRPSSRFASSARSLILVASLVGIGGLGGCDGGSGLPGESSGDQDAAGDDAQTDADQGDGADESKSEGDDSGGDGAQDSASVSEEDADDGDSADDSATDDGDASSNEAGDSAGDEEDSKTDSDGEESSSEGDAESESETGDGESEDDSTDTTESDSGESDSEETTEESTDSSDSTDESDDTDSESEDTETTGSDGDSLADLLPESLFEEMFPDRNPFYTYDDLIDIGDQFAEFGHSGEVDTRKREIAAFLANVARETGELVYIEQIAKDHYCSDRTDCRCQAGKMYYGRGPIQLSWNYNYCAAGEVLGLDLRANPDIVAQNAWVAWNTGLWFWMTQEGAGRMTCHDAIVNGRGFGETIRTINGGQECNGGWPSAVDARVKFYQKYCQMLGVDPGPNLRC